MRRRFMNIADVAQKIAKLAKCVISIVKTLVDLLG